MPRPPIDPDSFDKVNFVIDSWTTGCDAPWYIYIETMKPALLAAFITLITFGWDDVLRGFLRPRGLHPRRTGKRKGKWSRRAPRFPEIGELIGSNIPGAEEVKGKRWSTPMKTLWRIDSALQAIMFAWLVVEVVEDFAFEWTSLLYESYWCQPDPPGKFSVQKLGYEVTWDSGWKLIDFSDVDYKQPPPFWFVTHGETGPAPATITAALRCKARVGEDPPTSLRVVIWNTASHKFYADSGTNTDMVDDEIVGVTSGSLPAGVSFQVVVWMEGTDYADVGAGVVMGLEIKP